MIKANELRKGNKFRATNYPKMILTLSGFLPNETDNQTVVLFEEGEHFTTSLERGLIEAIPLTPEILEKWCLFRKETENNIIHYADENLQLNTYLNLNPPEYFWLRYYQGHKIKKIKFLHHFQNLYLDLTGEELTINNLANV